MMRFKAFFLPLIFNLSAYAESTACRPNLLDTSYSTDVDKFIENGGCLQFSPRAFEGRGHHYLILRLPQYSANTYTSELFTLFNSQAVHDILSTKMQNSPYILALSNAAGNNLALTISPFDSFARSFRQEFNLENTSKPMIVLYPRVIARSDQNLRSVLTHEFEHLEDINNNVWRRFRDSIQNNITTLDSVPERNRAHFLQSLFSLLIEFRPYTVQFNYLREHEPQSLRQRSIETYLEDHLYPYMEPVLRYAGEANDPRLFRSLCNIVKESAPDLFSVPMFKFNLDHICFSDGNHTHIFASVLCLRTYESYAIKVSLPSLTFERTGPGVINERIHQSLRTHFTPRRELRRGQRIPDSECEINITQVHDTSVRNRAR